MGKSDEHSIFNHALLAEMSHRHANEYAVALAALRLLKARTKRVEPMLEDTIDRLEGSVRIERLLLTQATTDMPSLLEELAELISKTRVHRPAFQLRIAGYRSTDRCYDVRLFLRVAYELLGNAAKHHALGTGPIDVLLAGTADGLRLMVSNATAHEVAARQFMPGGLLILRDLVAPARGRVAWRQGASQFSALVTFPFIQSQGHGREETQLTLH